MGGGGGGGENGVVLMELQTWYSLPGAFIIVRYFWTPGFKLFCWVEAVCVEGGGGLFVRMNKKNDVILRIFSYMYYF